MQYIMGEEEKAYLKAYNQANYDRPSVATDIVVFTIGKEESEDIRQLPIGKLRVLLINRASYPYKGMWALPGGFCRKNEEVYDTARRELFEETNIKDAYLNLSGIYGDVDRDPRGWIISHAFLALIDGTKCKLRADTDAWDAKWFDVDIKMTQEEKLQEEESIRMKNVYDLTLRCEEITLTALVREIKHYENYHEKVSYEIVSDKGIAFDHAKIIVEAFKQLQKSAQHDDKIIFDLMPEQFTLTELQKVFEIILQRDLLKANFRRKIADYVIKTEDLETGRGYRTANQYKRNIEKFYE